MGCWAPSTARTPAGRLLITMLFRMLRAVSACEACNLTVQESLTERRPAKMYRNKKGAGLW